MYPDTNTDWYVSELDGAYFFVSLLPVNKADLNRYILVSVGSSGDLPNTSPRTWSSTSTT